MNTEPNITPDPTRVPDHQAGPILGVARKVGRNIRDRLLGGLILVMPFLITFWVIAWMYSFLEKKVIDPLAILVLWKLKWTTSSTELPYWCETYAAPAIALLLVLAMLYCIDLLSDTPVRRAFGWALVRVPVISQIYNPVRKMFQALEKQPGQQQGPQRLVLVGFPHPGIKLPAFVTARCRDLATQKVLLCVYVPTTPVPTSGFFLLVPEEDVTELNWSSGQALEAIMSGGLTAPAEVSFFKTNAAADVKPMAVSP
jgi:uncharacterized membrane protein